MERRSRYEHGGSVQRLCARRASAVIAVCLAWLSMACSSDAASADVAELGAADAATDADVAPVDDATVDGEVIDGSDDVEDEPLPPRVCAPNSRRCLENGRSMVVCSDDGRSTSLDRCREDQLCRGGECFDLICDPEAPAGCDGEAAEFRCSPDGTEVFSVPCPSNAPECHDGACTSERCDGVEWRCDGDVAQLCGFDGRWETIQHCATGCIDGRCRTSCEMKLGEPDAERGCRHWLHAEPIIGGTQTVVGICAPRIFGDVEGLAWLLSNPSGEDVTVQVDYREERCEFGVSECARSVLRTVAPHAAVVFRPPDGASTDPTAHSGSVRVTASEPIDVVQFSESSTNEYGSLIPPATGGPHDLVLASPGTGSAGTHIALVGGTRSRVAAVTATSEFRVVDSAGTETRYPAGTSFELAASELDAAYAYGSRCEVEFNRNDLPYDEDFSGSQIAVGRDTQVFASLLPPRTVYDVPAYDEDVIALPPVADWGREYWVPFVPGNGEYPSELVVTAAESGALVSTQPASPLNGVELGAFETARWHTEYPIVLDATAPVQLVQFWSSAAMRPAGWVCPDSPEDCESRALVCDDLGAINPRRERAAWSDPETLAHLPTSGLRERYHFVLPYDWTAQPYCRRAITVVAPEEAEFRLDDEPLLASGVAFRETPIVDGLRQLDIAAPPDGEIHVIEADQPFYAVVQSHSEFSSIIYVPGHRFEPSE